MDFAAAALNTMVATAATGVIALALALITLARVARTEVGR